MENEEEVPTVVEYINELLDAALIIERSEPAEDYEQEDKEAQFKPGLTKFMDLLTTAANRAFAEQLIWAEAEHYEPDSLGRMVFARAGGLARARALEALEPVCAHMQTLEDPLGQLLEIMGWLSDRIAAIVDENDDIPTHKAQALMAGMWNIVMALSHRWIVERDKARNECTCCLINPSDGMHSLKLITDEQTEGPDLRQS